MIATLMDTASNCTDKAEVASDIAYILKSNY